MKYIAKILLLILSFSQVVTAEEGITIKPKGRFDFVLGIMDHKVKNLKRVSAHRNNFAFLSNASFTINATNRLSEDMAYGVQIALATSSRSDRKIQSHLFFESPAGKWELGSDKSAANKMKITGSSNASATGGAWDMWVKPDIRGHNVQYITNTGSFLDTKMRDPKNSEYSRKITYYTPEIYGFQGGISYIPDSTNIGENSHNLVALIGWYGGFDAISIYSCDFNGSVIKLASLFIFDLFNDQHSFAANNYDKWSI